MVKDGPYMVHWKKNHVCIQRETQTMCVLCAQIHKWPAYCSLRTKHNIKMENRMKNLSWFGSALRIHVCGAGLEAANTSYGLYQYSHD